MFEINQRVVNTHPRSETRGELGTVISVHTSGIHVQWDDQPLTTYYKNRYLRGESSWVQPLQQTEKSMSLRDYKGERVIYNNPSCPNRVGWTGTVTHAVERGAGRSYILVKWDQSPEETTRYTASALVGDAAYLILNGSEEKSDTELYLVAGERGGSPRRVYGYDAAVEYAERAAGNSKSGQAYLIFKPQERAERTHPPVTRTKL